MQRRPRQWLQLPDEALRVSAQPTAFCWAGWSSLAKTTVRLPNTHARSNGVVVAGCDAKEALLGMDETTGTVEEYPARINLKSYRMAGGDTIRNISTESTLRLNG